MASNDTDIKYFRFDNFGAPTLSNSWGQYVNILDACLVDGFGEQAVSSIVVTNGIGEATFIQPHKLHQFQVVQFSGTGVVSLNSEFKVLGVTTTTVQFLIDLPDYEYRGAYTCKLAPLKWSKPYQGTHKAVYRAADTAANPYFLRVDNSYVTGWGETYAKFAKVGFLASCTGIDDISGVQVPFNTSSPQANWLATGTGSSMINGWFKWQYSLVPTSSLSPGGWHESEGDGGDASRQWLLIGTKDSFYIINTFNSTNGPGGFLPAIPNGFCTINHNGTMKPFLFATNRHDIAGTGVMAFTGLSCINNPVTGGLFNSNNSENNSTLYSTCTLTGINNSGASLNSYAFNSPNTRLLSPLYIRDPSNVIMETPLPLVHHCATNGDMIPSFTLFTEGNQVFISSKYFIGTGGSPSAGSAILFYKVYEGDPL